MKKNLILGDSNASIEKNQMKCFCDTYGLKNLIKQPTYYKISINVTGIDFVHTSS